MGVPVAVPFTWSWERREGRRGVAAAGFVTVGEEGLLGGAGGGRLGEGGACAAVGREVRGVAGW
jgi:hypothetical protein